MNTEFLGAQLHHPLGRNFSLFLNYNFQHQTTDVPFCVGCALSFNRHMFGVGFDWHLRPAAFKPLG